MLVQARNLVGRTPAVAHTVAAAERIGVAVARTAVAEERIAAAVVRTAAVGARIAAAVRMGAAHLVTVGASGTTEHLRQSNALLGRVEERGRARGERGSERERKRKRMKERERWMEQFLNRAVAWVKDEDPENRSEGKRY